MIKTETKEINGKIFIYNYSDEGYLIRKVGTNETYENVYDLPEFNYTYEETENKIDEIEISYDRLDT